VTTPPPRQPGSRSAAGDHPIGSAEQADTTSIALSAARPVTCSPSGKTSRTAPSLPLVAPSAQPPHDGRIQVRHPCRFRLRRNLLSLTGLLAHQ
jgi:hypothetical protein